MKKTTRTRATIMFVGALSVPVFLFGSQAWAAATVEALAEENGQLRGIIAGLTDRVSALEGRLSAAESGIPAGESLVAEEGDGVVRSAGGDIRVSGFVDTSFNWNFQNPAGGTATNSTARAFDQNANTFDLNNAEIEIARPAPETDGVSAGFKTVFMYGSDAAVAEDFAFAGSVDEFSIQQAYAEVRIPQIPVFDDGLTVIAGKFATLHGAEVIENHRNWNASRSILFQNAIPFVHVGARASGTLMDGLFDVSAGLVNGWALAIDNNDIKDFESRLGWHPSENFSVSTGFMIGSQNFEDHNDERGLIDIVATWKPLPEDLPGLEFMANYDYGWEHDLMTAEGGVADWQGYALYTRYAINDKTALTYRFEQFQDDQAVRTASNEIFSHTITADRNVTDNLLLRAEYRVDLADSKTQFDSGTSDHQNTAMVSAIYKLA